MFASSRCRYKHAPLWRLPSMSPPPSIHARANHGVVFVLFCSLSGWLCCYWRCPVMKCQSVTVCKTLPLRKVDHHDGICRPGKRLLRIELCVTVGITDDLAI